MAAVVSGRQLLELTPLKDPLNLLGVVDSYPNFRVQRAHVVIVVAVIVFYADKSPIAQPR